MWDEMREGLVESLRRDGRVAARLGDLEEAVRAGKQSPASAARELLDAHGVPPSDTEG
jgi:hypothetical protein